MNRRAFVAGLGAVLAAPLGAKAHQAGKTWRVGLFHVGVDHVPPSLDGLRDGLKELGYEEGHNIRLDWRNLIDEDAARTTALENAARFRAMQPSTLRGEWPVTPAACVGGDVAGQLSVGNANENVAP